jgi:hypothetical protein
MKLFPSSSVLSVHICVHLWLNVFNFALIQLNSKSGVQQRNRRCFSTAARVFSQINPNRNFSNLTSQLRSMARNCRPVQCVLSDPGRGDRGNNRVGLPPMVPRGFGLSMLFDDQLVHGESERRKSSDSINGLIHGYSQESTP